MQAKGAFACILLGLVLAAGSIGTGFYMDDWTNMWNARQADWSPDSLGTAFVHGARHSQDGHLPAGYEKPVAWYYRPVLVALFKVEDRLFGLDPRARHGVNLLLHGANALMLVLLVNAIGGGRRRALWAAALFVFHAPAGVACAWISGRTELVMAFFLLASVLAYGRFRQGRGPGWLAASLLMAAGACGAKEQALLLPLILAAFDRLVHPARRFTLWPLLFLLPMGILGVHRASLPGVNRMPPASFYFHPPGEEGFFLHVLARGGQSVLGLFQLMPFAPMAYRVLVRPAVVLGLVVAAGFLALVLRREVAGLRGGVFLLFWIVLFTGPTLMCSQLPLYLYVPALGATALVAGLAEDEDGTTRRTFLRRHRRVFLFLWIVVGGAAMVYVNAWLARTGALQLDLVEQVRALAPPPPLPVRVHVFGCTVHMSALKAALRLGLPGRDVEFHGMTMSHRFMGRRAQSARWLASVAPDGFPRLRVDVGPVHPTRNPLFDSLFTRPVDFDTGDAVSTPSYELRLEKGEEGYRWVVEMKRPLEPGDLFFLALPGENRHLPQPGQGQ